MHDKEIPKYPIYDNGQLHISISQRNGKLGNIPQFNTLPGDELLRNGNGQYLTNIKGTCGGCCSDCKSSCYAIKCCLFHHNSTIPAWGRNTVIMRNDPEKVKREIKDYCTKNIVRYFRFHTSGEIESLDQLKLYCEICNENQDVVFYIYTKRFDLIAEYFVLKENPLPENFVINLSEWHENVKKFLSTYDEYEGVHDFFDKLNVFAFDDKCKEAEYASTLVHCPAIDKTGHETGVTCAQCRRCMKPGHKTAVYEH